MRAWVGVGLAVGLVDSPPAVGYNLKPERGPVAQLGARFNRTEEVAGSNPARSTRQVTNPRAHSAAGSASQWH